MDYDKFDGDIDNVKILAIDFVGDTPVCDDEKCDCGMELPWGLFAEVGTDEFSVSDSSDEDEETISQLIARTTTIETALMSAREFEKEHECKVTILLTDAAHWTMKLEVAFEEAKKTGNINWEDMEFSEPTSGENT